MPLKVIDVAGGTGDISFRILNKAKADSPHSKFLKQTNYNDRAKPKGDCEGGLQGISGTSGARGKDACQTVERHTEEQVAAFVAQTRKADERSKAIAATATQARG